MIYGKVIGGLLGLVLFGWSGLIIGVALGHLFDWSLALHAHRSRHLPRRQQAFFQTCFALLGYLAKLDGRVSDEEIEHTEIVMHQMGIRGQDREHAITMFRQGAADDFQLEQALTDFNRHCPGQQQLRRTLLEILISQTYADQKLDQAEYEALQNIAVFLRFNQAVFHHLLQSVQARSHFRGHYEEEHQEEALLDDAYRVLGVHSQCDDRKLKQAYRRLMSKHHPDRLIAQGLPHNMIQVATEKAQEIQAAYELIRKNRRARTHGGGR